MCPSFDTYLRLSSPCTQMNLIDLTPGQRVDQFFEADGTLEECRTRAARYRRALLHVPGLRIFRNANEAFVGKHTRAH